MARAVRAGFTKLHPMPPKSILTSTMASTAPTAGIHKGTETGRLYARRSPVTTALISPTLWGLLAQRA